MSESVRNEIRIDCPHVLLRTVREDDAEAFVPLHEDPDVIRLMGAQPTSVDEQRRAASA